MKKLFCIVVVMVALGHSAIAQEKNLSAGQAVSLKAGIVNHNLEISWQGGMEVATGAYWQVEASRNGKIFKTIGYVWGSENGNCLFRQNTTNLKKGFKYYRVLSVKDAGTAIASHIVTL